MPVFDPRSSALIRGKFACETRWLSSSIEDKQKGDPLGTAFQFRD